MYNADRRSQEFIEGEANKRDGFMCCTCAICKNLKEYASSRSLHSHLLKSGFMSNYICWTKHRETGVVMEEVKKNNGAMMTFLLNMVPSMILQWGKLKKRWGQRRSPLNKRWGQRRSPLTILVRPFMTHKENAKVKRRRSSSTAC